MDEATEKRWRELSEEILSGMKEWRLAHPDATFREIEETVHARMSRMEAQMLQETAFASRKADWAQDPSKNVRPVHIVEHHCRHEGNGNESCKAVEDKRSS
jgi:hypothetical protein